MCSFSLRPTCSVLSLTVRYSVSGCECTLNIDFVHSDRCAIVIPFQYYGRQPKCAPQMVFLEDSYIAFDPFLVEQRPLCVGSKCFFCEEPVSTFTQSRIISYFSEYLGQTNNHLPTCPRTVHFFRMGLERLTLSHSLIFVLISFPVCRCASHAQYFTRRECADNVRHRLTTQMSLHNPHRILSHDPNISAACLRARPLHPSPLHLTYHPHFPALVDGHPAVRRA